MCVNIFIFYIWGYGGVDSVNGDGFCKDVVVVVVVVVGGGGMVGGGRAVSICYN